MTAIALFEYEDSFAVMGDVMVSGLEGATPFVTLPGIGKIPDLFPAGSGFVPVGLTQKVVIVSPNAAVAWSGSEIAARYYVRELYRRVTKVGYGTAALINGWLETLRQDAPDLSVLGFCMLGSASFYQFGYGRGHKTTSPSCGTVMAGGSGGGHIVDLIENIPGPISRRPPPNHPSSLELGMVVAGGLLQREIGQYIGPNSDAPPTLHYYGGGFEFATASGATATKVGDILYLFWSAVLDENSLELVVPFAFYKFSYHNEILLIISGKLGSSSDPTITNGINISSPEQPRVHVVEPLLRKTRVDERQTLPRASLEPAVVCHQFLVKSPAVESLGMVTQVRFSDTSREPHFTFSWNEGDGVSLFLSSTYLRGLTDALRTARPDVVGRMQDRAYTKSLRDGL
jgi:hypothetical protein